MVPFHLKITMLFLKSAFLENRGTVRTWKAGSEVLYQSLLVDRLVGSIHSRNGQAQDFPQRNELRLADGRHTDRRHVTCRRRMR